MIQMRSNQEAELILGRLEKEYILKKTNNKEVWLLTNIYTGEKYVGKSQAKNKLDKVNVKNVLHEASFLQQLQGHSGIPLMYWSGVEGIQILVILQYLGMTIDERLKQCGGKFTLKTTCMIGITILKIIRNLHQKGVVHRNLNPTSIQFGRGLKSSQLYLNDMIECKKYRNKKSYAHILVKKGIKYTHQNIYGSTRFHRNEQIARIDDIQNIIKILIRLNTGVEPNKKGEFSNIKIPVYLKEMLNHCQKYEFSDQPNYQWFNQKLLSTLFHHSHQYDKAYDWMLIPNRIQSLRVSKDIVSLKIEQDKQILAEFYDPYQQSIDIDQVTTKYHKFYRENEGKVSQNPIQNKKGIQLQQKIRKRKSIQRQRQRQKADCNIM